MPVLTLVGVVGLGAAGADAGAVQYREVLTGTRGSPVVPGAVCQIRYTVYRLSSGAYFKESSGGKPVYMFSSGYGKEGKVCWTVVVRHSRFRYCDDARRKP
jgi:hypothetical protein